MKQGMKAQYATALVVASDTRFGLLSEPFQNCN